MYEIKFSYIEEENPGNFSDEGHGTWDIADAYDTDCTGIKKDYPQPPSAADILRDIFYSVIYEKEKFFQKDGLINHINDKKLEATFEGYPTYCDNRDKKKKLCLRGFKIDELPAHDLNDISNAAAALYDADWRDTEEDRNLYWQQYQPYTSDEDILDWAKERMDIFFDYLREYEESENEDNEEEEED